jgi:hypothetical protein
MAKLLVHRSEKNDPEEIERQEDEQKKKLGVVHRHYDRVFYKLDGKGYRYPKSASISGSSML